LRKSERERDEDIFIKKFLVIDGNKNNEMGKK